MATTQLAHRNAHAEWMEIAKHFDNTPMLIEDSAACPAERVPGLDCGAFRTPYEPSHRVVVGAVGFKVPSCFTRTVLLGISHIDVTILRLKAEVRCIADDRAIVNVSTWGDTKHWQSECSWLSIPPDDPDIQTGRYTTTQDHPWSESQKSTSRRIAFAHPYATPPKVIVWLDAVDSGPGRNVRVRTWADQIDATGFTIHVDTWADSNLWSAGASWLAHSADRRDVRSGQFEIGDIRPSDSPQHTNTGRVSWGAPRMARPPRVFTALRALDFQDGKNIRIKTITSEITTTGMTWNLESRDDTIMYQAGAVYFAFNDDESGGKVSAFV